MDALRVASLRRETRPDHFGVAMSVFSEPLRSSSSSKVDQDDIRVFPHSIEHDLLAVGGHIEGLRGSGVVQAAQLARRFLFQIEQPEVLRPKRSCAYTSAKPFGRNR